MICTRLMGTVLVLLVGGCVAPFPPIGFGGMDEAFTYTRADARPKSTAIDVNAHHTLARQLDGFKLRIERERSGAGQLYRPALMQTIQIQWDRTARAIAGGLLPDAKIDLEHLALLFAKLDADLAELSRLQSVTQASSDGENI